MVCTPWGATLPASGSTTRRVSGTRIYVRYQSTKGENPHQASRSGQDGRSLMKAMVLAAGLGTRLRPLTYEITKPMVPVLDRPVMEHILDLIDRHSFDGVIANLHYFPDTIREYFGERISYSYEQELLGTAGGVRNCAEFFGDEPFLVISGDALTDIDLTAFADAPPRGGGDRDAGGQARGGHARVRSRPARRRRAHHRLSGEAGARGGALRSRQLRHLHVRPAHLRLLPRPPVRRLGQRRLPGAARARRALLHP